MVSRKGLDTCFRTHTKQAASHKVMQLLKVDLLSWLVGCTDTTLGHTIHKYLPTVLGYAPKQEQIACHNSVPDYVLAVSNVASGFLGTAT